VSEYRHGMSLVWPALRPCGTPETSSVACLLLGVLQPPSFIGCHRHSSGCGRLVALTLWYIFSVQSGLTLGAPLPHV
jgi:hypothetical protein